MNLNLVLWVFVIIFNFEVHGWAASLNKCPGSTLNNSIVLPESIMANEVDTKFFLDSGKWGCKHGFLTELILAKVPSAQVTANNESLENSTTSKKLEFSRLIEPSGVLKLELERYEEFYQPHEYCVLSVSDSEIIVQVCQIKCGEDKLCIPKCCDWDQALTSEIECEIKNEQEWYPPVHYNDTHKDCGDGSKSTNCIDEDWKKQHLHYQLVAPYCVDDFHHFQSKDNPFQILANGSILLHISKTKALVLASNFCLDGLLDKDGETLVGHVVITCPVEETAQEKDDRMLTEEFSLWYSVVMFITSFFLLMTAVIYVLIWDKQNLHGYTIFSHSVSMFFMMIFLGLSHTINRGLYLDTERGSACVAFALLSHYFILSTFCWLTMLNFDLWWTFRTLSPTIKSKGLRRFLYYSIFSWGFPLCFVSTSVILDKTGSDEHESWFPRAHYARDNCYIEYTAQGLYLYTPIALLLGVNLLFFGTTVYVMYKYQQSTRSARAGKTNGQSQSFQVFAKLFLVMGVTWVFEVISWGFSQKGVVSWWWSVFDFINLLQGIGIFIIFVCKRQVLSHLWNKYPCLRGILSPLTRLACCKPTGMDVEGRENSGGKTTQSNISMKNYSRANSSESSK